MKSKWELARYLIDAKKNVDSMWFVADNVKQLQYIDLRKKIRDLHAEFCLKCCFLLDEYILLREIRKKDLCAEDSVINRIYYERDKNIAHKDDQYLELDYPSIYGKKEEMEKQIIRVREVTTDCLPDILTLDFVPHDRELFRIVHRLNADEEDAISKRKYPYRDSFQDKGEGRVYKVFSDTEDIRKIPDNQKSEYAVVEENGICFNEGVQTRQDACIRFNVLWNQNMWCSINKALMDKVKKLTELGYFDAFGIIQPLPRDPILRAKIEIILETLID